MTLNENAKILIAEDNPMEQKLMTNHLSSLGFWNIDILTSGKKVIERWEQEHYDVIFMDFYLDDEYDKMEGFDSYDGLDAVREIRKREKTKEKKTYIIAYTGASYNVAIDEANEAGTDFFLNKPAKIEDVKNIMIEIGALKKD